MREPAVARRQGGFFSLRRQAAAASLREKNPPPIRKENDRKSSEKTMRNHLPPRQESGEAAREGRVPLPLRAASPLSCLLVFPRAARDF